jgi:hypothetical protein
MARKGAIRFWQLEASAAALLLWSATTAWAGLPKFNTIEIGFGNGPDAEAVDDFNGDGKRDLAVANADGDSVSIFINTGTGLGASPVQVMFGTSSNPLNSPQGIVAGDFNNDGYVDLAVTNYSGSSVSIFLNDGTGHFTSPFNIGVAANPLGIATGRFRTGSASLDLVVVTKAANSSGQVGLLLNNGHGWFAVQAPVVVGSKPKRVAVGDFGTASQPLTRDGVPDVAVTLNGEAKVAVLYGDGNGHLSTTPVKFTVDTGPIGIVAADFNNDNCLDLATANHDGTTANTVDVLIGCDTVNNASFSGAQQVSSGSLGAYADTTAVTAVDFNNDGKLDIAAVDTGSSGTSNDRLVLLQNNIDLVNYPRSARFLAPVYCAVGDKPMWVVAAKFNQDDFADFAVANRSSDNISIMNGTGADTCSTPTQIGGYATGKTPVSVALCNVTDATGNGNPDPGGVLDLLVLDQTTGNVLIFGNDGNGNFTRGSNAVSPFVGATTASSVACAGNWDNDPNGYSDFAVTYQGSNSAALFCNRGVVNGVLTFVTAPDPSCPTLGALTLDSPRQVIAADFDGIAPLDLAIPNYGNATVTVIENAGVTTLSAGTDPISVAAGKFSTAANDLAAANYYSKTVSTWSNNGSGGLAGNPAQSLGSYRPYWVTTGDLNMDAKDDIITANQAADNVDVLISAGGGAFGNPTPVPAGNGADSAAVADFDMDGHQDIAVADLYSDVISILPGDGTGAVTACPNNTASCEYDTAAGPLSIAVGNLNNDTYPDLVVAGNSSITILLNAYTPPTPTPTPCSSCPTPTPGHGC